MHCMKNEARVSLQRFAGDGIILQHLRPARANAEDARSRHRGSKSMSKPKHFQPGGLGKRRKATIP